MSRGFYTSYNNSLIIHTFVFKIDLEVMQKVNSQKKMARNRALHCQMPYELVNS